MKTKTNKNIFAVAMLSVLLLFSVLLFPIKAQNVVMATDQFSGTDLSGTTWEIDLSYGNFDNAYTGTYNINFTSNGNQYVKLYKNRDIRYYYTDNDYVLAHSDDDGGWENPNYATIIITGGTDADSSGSNFLALKSLLNGYATLISSPTPGPTPTPGTGVMTDVVMPGVLILITGFVATMFVLQNKKQKPNLK